MRDAFHQGVRPNRRIIFRFEGEDAHDVELIDYH